MAEGTVRSLSVNGVRYSYRLLERTGPVTGPVTEPVVVLGGALQGMLGWPQMEGRLGPVASVVTADLPGMGTAAPLPPGPSADMLCAAVTRIIDDLDVPRVNLFGFSYGAAPAFRCAQRNPGRIARLLLGGVPAHITDAQRAHWQRATDRLAAGDTDGFATLVTEALMCLDPERYVARRDLAYRYVKRSMLHAVTHSPHAADSVYRSLGDRPDFSGGLSGVPALVFTGEHDTVTSAERQRAFAATIRGSRFTTVRDTDHWVVLEKAEEVADLALRFFTDRPLEPGGYLTSGPQQERVSGRSKA
ncbi:alpha/beta hydrolase [Streptomyces sp. ISL-99]|uniref:alpha/beta fold hydrolase n=1 Tax=Streptomyces sp. ISL-99 TaxID=2819193 RepID=UPI001BE807F8|nr:alpha/beta hydrolase [Streptomyces sp. ISL-99]MBT2524239.1 alpha/beta hydrolase [Streptomyces sp. ISL-99]